MQLKTTDLIVNGDGSIYHLHLKPEQIAETIITVGDQDRVADVSQHFDVIEHKAAHREFVTHTGVMNNKRITVISTGIGTDNIDIVLNELDALTNIDFVTKAPKAEIKSLDIIRIGTSGCVQADIPINSILFSEYSIGLEGLLNHYYFENTAEEKNLRDTFLAQVPLKNIYPYCFAAGESLIKKFEPHFRKGLTVTAEGFYAPQGRVLRYTNNNPDFVKQLNAFTHKNFRVTNLEMETAGIYGLGKVLGHSCISINAILANRITDEFSVDPKKIVDDMIVQVLDILTKITKPMLAFLRFKNPLFKLAKPILFFLFIMGIGTVGYVTIEKFTFLEALYMTVVTLSTVGYMEVKPLSDAGRYFTIFIILTNLSLLTFYLTILTRYFTDGEFIKDYKSFTMDNKIEMLKDHVIICGFGRNGLAASNIFKANHIPFVIIESTKDQIEKRNVHVEHFIIADATKDETLIEAGILRAKAIITTLPDDAANLYTVLTARELNKSITIISRASNDASVKKLKIAGANNVIMPDKIGGIHMATLVSSPDINEFIDIIAAKSSNDFLFQELEIQQSFALDKTDFLARTGATIIGIKKSDNSYILNPEESIAVEKSWKLILMCTKEQMEKAKELFS